jgi:hypothetical protein
MLCLREGCWEKEESPPPSPRAPPAGRTAAECRRLMHFPQHFAGEMVGFLAIVPGNILKSRGPHRDILASELGLAKILLIYSGSVAKRPIENRATSSKYGIRNTESTVLSRLGTDFLFSFEKHFRPPLASHEVHIRHTWSKATQRAAVVSRQIVIGTLRRGSAIEEATETAFISLKNGSTRKLLRLYIQDGRRRRRFKSRAREPDR